MAHDVFGGAAHQQVAQAGATMGRGDDEVGADFTRHFEYAVECEALSDDDTRRKRRWDFRSAYLFKSRLNRRNTILSEWTGVREIGWANRWIQDMQQCDLCAKLPGEGHGVLQRFE